ncbi:MAG: L-histidine N(alpha)-methyltransferase [Bacteroidia bacterium]|nr:L-histidine N(alpha)-methyltransferase [Bacteroidia bacterium]
MDSFAEHVRLGLTAPSKFLSSGYIYDQTGSQIFSEIMDMPEYYPARAERSVFDLFKREIFANLGHPAHLRVLDLGAGDGRKTRILLKEFSTLGCRLEYFPLDISPKSLEVLSREIRAELPEIEIFPLAGSYEDALAEFPSSNLPTLAMFLGSNLGNFSPGKDGEFLQMVRKALQPGDFFLLGVDLKKDPRLIQKAYDDAQGISARFNLNLLTRINRELGGDFDLQNFRHFPVYDPETGVMKSYLLSEKAHLVKIKGLNLEVNFQAWETIHVEYSRKYTAEGVQSVLENAHMRLIRNYSDPQNLFLDALARVNQ